MKFSRYCKDRWISIFILVFVLCFGSGILWLIDVPFYAACIVEGVYCAGFFLMLVPDYLERKEFYDKLLDRSSDLEETAYLSEFLSKPYFQEGELLYEILRRNEKYINDQLAEHERRLDEYKEYVEIWVHEIKTPIAISRLIMENHRDHVTRSLSEEMDKVEAYVEQMLYYSKGSSLNDDYNIRPVQLRRLVMGAVKEQAKFMIAEKVTPEFADLEHLVLTDTKWMQFILCQIISNGVKYHREEPGRKLRFAAVQNGKNVTLSISDNGIGIAREDIDRVLRKGFTGATGRKFKKSTGMGLYLCDTLAKKLGTELSVLSEEGKGTVVSLELTAASAEDTTYITKV